MPIQHESYCEGIRRCCCSSSNRVTNYRYDVGSSESEDEILNSQLVDIEKILQPNAKPVHPKSCCHRFCLDFTLSGVDTYFFKYTMWQNMHLGTVRGFKHLDFTLYRFIYAVVAICLFLYYINIVTNEAHSIGMIYFEAWILLVNAFYSAMFLVCVLKDKYRLYRKPEDANLTEEELEAQDVPFHTINPLQIRELQDNPVDKITPLYQGCWLLLDIFMATHFALAVVQLAGYWIKRKSTDLMVSIVVIHVIHAIGAIVEVFVSRIPIRLSHFIYPIIFTHLYVGYTIIDGYIHPLIFTTMDWRNDFVNSYIRILVFCSIIIGFHVMLYGIFRFREWLVYKVERNHHVHVAHKDAFIRRKARRRIRLDVILDKCNSEEMFEYVNKHIDLFPEVITELKEFDPWKKDVMELRETLLAKEDQNLARERRNEKRARAAKRLQLRIEERAKHLSVEDVVASDKKQDKGAFNKLMNDVMNVVIERRRQEKAEKERLAIEAKESAKLKEEAHKKWLEDHRTDHVYPKGNTGYIEDYIEYFDGCKSQPMKVLGKPGPHYASIEREREEQQKAIIEYDNEVEPPNRDGELKTFSGLPIVLVDNEQELREQNNPAPDKEDEEERVETRPMDEYDLQLELIRLEKIEKGHFPPLDHHIETVRLWVNPELIKNSDFSPVLGLPSLDDPALEESEKKVVRTTKSKQEQIELQKPPPFVPTNRMLPKVKFRKKNPRYDRHGMPPPAPEGAKIVYLEPVPKEIDGPEKYKRIPRIPDIRFPEKKWYQIDTFEPEEKKKQESKSKQRGITLTPSLMEQYGQTVDIRILERIRAKQQELEEQVDHGMRLRPSGRVGSRRRRVSKKLQERRRKDWDLNIELFHYLKAHQDNRDKRLAMKPARNSKKDGSRPREISIITSPESSTASVMPILIAESLTEQDKEKILIKQPGTSILQRDPKDKKDDEPPPKKFITNEDGTRTAIVEEEKVEPTLSEIRFERRAAQIQVRTDAHGPIAGGIYHPLRPPPVKQAQVRTTFHYIDDKLPHTGGFGMTYVDTNDVPAYSEHPGIHIHHPMLHLDKPEGPLPLLKEAMKEQAAKRARLKSGNETAAPKKNKVKYGDSENRKEMQVVAFHPIVQFHSLTQLLTEASNEELYDLEELGRDNENSLVEVIKHHENWLHRENLKEKKNKQSKRRRRRLSDNKNKPF